jgi:hypothetical protein
LWIATALAIIVAANVHPSTTANASLSVRKVSFRTSAKHILSPSIEEQLLISRVGTLQIRGNHMQIIGTGSHLSPAKSLNVLGEPSASCSFYRIRSGPLDLSGPSIVTLEWMDTSGGKSFSLAVHGSISGTLTSQPSESHSKPGFTCTRVRVNGGPAGNVEVKLSPEGTDSIFFVTSFDARLDFDPMPESEIGDTQVPILDEIRFSDVDPRTSEEKTVLLKPPPGYKNEVSFENLDKKVILDDADLLALHPENNFYLRQFTVKDGLQLEMHGVVTDVRVGAGAGDLQTCVPSLFDHLDNKKRVYGLIPAVAALILGVLEKMGVLRGK